MKGYIFFVILLVSIFMLGCEIEQPIGGERDEYGCLGPAGYSYDNEIGACTRNWEIKDESEKRAAKVAVDYLGKSKGLTVVQIIPAECVGCFALKFTKGTEQIEVILKDLEVIEGKPGETLFECETDDDCVSGGCSGTVCQSKDAEPIFTTCEYMPEYACYKQIECGCIDGKCGWEKTAAFERCVREARESDIGPIV